MDQPTTSAGTPLRRQVLFAIVGIAAVGITLFAIPLGVAVQRLYHDEAITALERDATRIAAIAPDDEAAHPRPVPIPGGLSDRLTVGIYRTDGTRIAGSGPSHSELTADERAGSVNQAIEGGDLAVSAPIPSEQGVSAVVRVSVPYSGVRGRVVRAWLLMAALAVVIMVFAAVFARWQARRLARPLEELTEAAQALGDGDFSIRAGRSGVREADAAGLALEATARRLGEVLDRERAFSAHVSHQLRTPLTGLLLGLESALDRPHADLRTAISTALERGEHLHDIIDDLLKLARHSGPAASRLDVPGLLEELQAQWNPPLAAAGRLLTIQVHAPLPDIWATPPAVRQILGVLIDNAAVHGSGRIVVEASDVGTGLAIDVSDEGPGVPDTDDIFAPRTVDGHGIGLALARSLAETEGGRLVLRRPSPPIFTVLLPTPDPDRSPF